MMIVKVFTGFILGTFLVACAQVNAREVSAPIEAKKSELVEEAEASQNKVTGLDPTVMFNLLGGEIAGQRGEMNYATHFYVNAAKLSGDKTVALRAAQIALFNKDVAAAVSAVEILMQQEQPSAQIMRFALTVYLRAGDADKSLQQSRRLLAMSDIPYRNALLAIGDVVARTANKKTAGSVINALIADKPDEAAGYLARSQIELRFKELQLARADAYKAIQLAPEWKVAHAQYAQVLESNGESAKALAVLKAATKTFLDSALKMGYAQLLAKNELYEKATEQFKQLLVNDKEYHEARFSLGLVYLKRDMPELAKQAFTRLYEADVFSVKAAFYLGSLHYQQKDYQKAHTWFSKIESGPLYLDAQANMVMIISKQGDLKGARAMLQDLRSKFPEQVTRFYMQEGEILFDANDYEGSFKLMNEAVKAQPDNLVLRYTRAIAATELNRIDVAEQDLRFVLNKQPGDVNAMNALGYTLASQTSRFEEAKVLLEKAISARPEDPAILDSMGWLKFRIGNFEEALVLLQKAYEIEPDAEIASHLGETLWELGRQAEAKMLWQEAVKKDPDSRFLKQVQQRLK
jgi:tetratricopeptide (TPR) repeat protein